MRKNFIAKGLDLKVWYEKAAYAKTLQMKQSLQLQREEAASQALLNRAGANDIFDMKAEQILCSRLLQRSRRLDRQVQSIMPAVDAHEAILAKSVRRQMAWAHLTEKREAQRTRQRLQKEDDRLMEHTMLSRATRRSQKQT